jgi:ribosomal-protein-alanine N-acetyltransferase
VPIPKLVGRRVDLRALRPSDAAALEPMMRDRRVTKWLPPTIRTVSAQQFVTRLLTEARRGDGPPLAILPRGSTEVVGQIRLFHWSRVTHTAEVGYWLRRSSWGNGLASEALALTCRYGFRSMSLHRIQAKVVVGNDASRRVLEKVGFRLEGTARESARVARKWTDVWDFGLLRDELVKP